MRNIVLVGLLLSGTLCAVLYSVGFQKSVRPKADIVATFGPEPQTLDPGAMSGVNEARYAYALFEGLVTFAEDGVTCIPGVAESWTISDDKTVYTFKLKKTQWSNGDPLTVHDFIWSWLRANDPATGSDYAQMTHYIKNMEGWHYAKGAIRNLRKGIADPEKHKAEVEALFNGACRDMIPELEAASGDRAVFDEAIRRARERDVGLRAIDDYTLEVKLGSPAPFMLDIFGFHTLMPVNRRCIETHKDAWLKPQNFVGNGPFVVEEWWPQYRITLRKNPKYWDAAHVRSNRIALLILDSASTSMNYYDTGRCDFLDRIQIPSDFLKLLSQRPDFHRYSAFGSYFLRYCVTKPPFNDPRVRKAFTHAIDRKPVTERILMGGEFPYDLLTPPFPGFDPGTKGCPYDPEKARALMDEVYPDRSKFPYVEFLTRNSKKGLDLYAHLRQQWKEVLGVTVGSKAQEWSVYLTSMSKLDYDLSYGGWLGDYSDPHTFIDIWITGGGNNRTGWSDPEYDAWVKQALQETETAKRFAIYSKCEKRVVEEACIIAPLYVTAERVMHKPYLKGVQSNPMDRILLKYFYREP